MSDSVSKWFENLSRVNAGFSRLPEASAGIELHQGWTMFATHGGVDGAEALAREDDLRAFARRHTAFSAQAEAIADRYARLASRSGAGRA
jgi:hypothetical protein